MLFRSLEGNKLPVTEGIYLLDKQVEVLLEEEGMPCLTVHPFGKGKGIYLSGFRFDTNHAQLLLRVLGYGAGCEGALDYYVPDNTETDCAYFKTSQRLVVINHSGEQQVSTIGTREQGQLRVSLAPYEMRMIQL